MRVHVLQMIHRSYGLYIGRIVMELVAIVYTYLGD